MGINDVIKSITIDEIQSEIVHMKYALIYQISNVFFDKTDKISEINWEECIEGYFFDETKQIHVYSTEEGLQGVIFIESENIEYVDKKYELAGKYQTFGKYIMKREYLDYDEDGQVYVAYTRLVDVK